MKSYGMFTDSGNSTIHGVVLMARVANMSWDQVVEVLYDLSTMDGLEEASDTVVREAVYMELKNG